MFSGAFISSEALQFQFFHAIHPILQFEPICHLIDFLPC
uniref:Uncharacterized protein n=1 Tax=Rhizophora mucronata TaxID=61149 RepID=A0A2P2P767_RHIMU